VGVVPGLRITRTALRFSCTQVMPRWMRTGHDAAGQYPPGRSAICLVGSSLIHCDDLESVAIASVSLRTATGCWDHCVPHPRILLVLRKATAHHSCATLLCRPCWSCGMLLCFCLSTIHPCDMPDQIGRSSLRFLRWGRPPRATSGQCTTPVGTVKRRSWERLRCSPSLTLPSRLKHLAGRGAPSQPPPQWWKPLAASTTTSQLGWLCSLDGRPVAAAAERSCVGLFQVGTSAVLSRHGSRDKPGHERVLRSCADASFVVLACSIL
jgi:hypothetical protein